MPKIQVSFKGRVRELPASGGILGRPADDNKPDVPVEDARVSRKHLRVWCADGEIWAQDLGSTHGTRFGNEVQKAGHAFLVGKQGLVSLDRVAVQLHLLADEELADREALADPIVFLGRLASTLATASGNDALSGAIRLLAARTPEAEMLGLFSRRGTDWDALVVQPDGATITHTFIERAYETRKPYVWSPDNSDGVIPTYRPGRLLSRALYSPVIWDGEVLGVLALEVPRSAPFNEADVGFQSLAAQLLAGKLQERLLQSRLQRVEQEANNLALFLSKPTGDRVRSWRGKVKPAVETREVAVLFSDLRGFTRFCASHDPEQVTKLLEDYLTPLVASIERLGGIADTFLGDGIMALFPARHEEDDHALRAVRAALEMRASCETVSRAREQAGHKRVRIGIGIHLGDTLVGFLGARSLMEYTTIGDVANRASRLCHAARDETILISAEVQRRTAVRLRKEARFEEATGIHLRDAEDTVVYALKPISAEGQLKTVGTATERPPGTNRPGAAKPEPTDGNNGKS